MGVDNREVQNDFDNTEIYSEMKEITDHLGNSFILIPKFYIKKLLMVIQENGIYQKKKKMKVTIFQHVL